MVMKNTLIWDKNYDFLDVLKILDQEGNGFLVIVDEQNTLLGMVTDGDVRRAILNKTTEVWEIINKNPITILDHYSPHDGKAYLRSISRRQAPIVDAEGRLIDIIYLDDQEHHFKPNKVVIMAGGLGSRLGDLTKDIPKPMLLVGNKPILENIIISFKEAGYNEFIFCVGYKSEIIESYFQNGEKWGVEISYNYENKKMGTAGALGLIKEGFKHPFFVVNADILTSINFNEFMEFHLQSKAVATMCVKKFNYQVPYACIESNAEGKILALSEKPLYDYQINAGMYILEPGVKDEVPFNEYYDMTTLFTDLIFKGEKVMRYNIDEYWLDIGIKADYTKANHDVQVNLNK
jgi:dTDP-glucose pyrophosphorylase